MAIGIYSICLWLPAFFYSIEAKGCGFPGIPRNGNIIYSRFDSRSNESEILSEELIITGTRSLNYSEILSNKSMTNILFPVNTRVEYDCEQPGRFILKGDKERFCQYNGTWTGHSPICDENVAYGKTVKATKIGKEQGQGRETHWLTDGIMNDTSKAIVFKLSDLLHIEFPPDSLLSFRNFYFNEGRVLNGQPDKIKDMCEHSQPNNATMEYNCSGNIVVDRSIRMISTRKDDEITLFEIEIFVRSEKSACGIPEIPSNGQVTLLPNDSNPLTAIYSCYCGHEISTTAERKCIGKNWSGPVPMCLKNAGSSSTVGPKIWLVVVIFEAIGIICITVVLFLRKLKTEKMKTNLNTFQSSYELMFE